MAAIFSSPKVKVHNLDGADIVQDNVIITDSSNLIDEEIEALQVIPRPLRLSGSLGTILLREEMRGREAREGRRRKEEWEIGRKKGKGSSHIVSRMDYFRHSCIRAIVVQ